MKTGPATATLVLLLAASSAVAQPSSKKPSTVESKKKALEHFERGRNAYNFGNYNVAVAEYEAAFALTGAPEYVFNIAQTYRTAGNKRAAVEYYKKYLALDPAGSGVTSAREHVAALEAELHAEDEAETQRRRDAEEAERKREQQIAADRVAAVRAASEAAKREALASAEREIAVAEVGRRRSSARTLRIAGFATGGGGVALLGGAAFFGWRARTLSRDVSAVDMWSSEAKADMQRAERADTTMFVLLGVGGVAVASGLVLYMLGRVREPDEINLRVSADPSPGGATVVLHGRF